MEENIKIDPKKIIILHTGSSGKPDWVIFSTLLFFLLLTNLMLSPYISKILPMIIIGDLIFIVILSIILLLPIHKYITNKFMKITVDDIGIRFGFKCMQWEDLGSVQLYTPLFFPYDAGFES